MCMSNDLSTSITLLVAQNAGTDGAALAYSMMAPGALVALCFVVMVIVLGLLSWLFDFITDHDEYYVP